MLSHDTRLRCDLVDLYFTLYGNRRPVCLPIPELANILKPQKIHQTTPPPGPEAKRIKTMAPIRGNQMNIIDTLKKTSPVPIKTETDVIVLDNNINVVDMEVVVEEPKPKIKVFEKEKF